MQYDPIKRGLGEFFNRSPFSRRIFYRLLDILLLRTWHVKKAINSWKKNMPGKAEILDAGSGFGQYSYFLARTSRNSRIHGVDVKIEQIEDCNNFFWKSGLTNATFEYADLTQFVAENFFDLILSVDVMEHIEEDMKVFENFSKSLKPGGMLLISTPSDKGGSDVHNHHDHYQNDGTASFIDEHVRDGYNIDEIQEKLKKGGFGKTEALYTYGWPGSLSWKLSMKYPILMLNISKVFYLVLPFYYLLTFWFALILNFFDVRLNHKTGTGLVVKAWK